ncbi:aldo/keto reductase [Ruminococcaceae bacterium OttesenSCG-928-I18]|nr:aldo/keto reductase [Ruminococcaceae bacterium OttesenSCG-928-I18]
MKKIELSSSLQLAPVAIGTMGLMDWGLDKKQLLSRVHEYLDEGLSTYDLADIYGGGECERFFGEMLTLEPSLRDKLEIVTKGGIVFDELRRPYFVSESYNLSKEYLISACENSLKRLGVESIDLYLLHRPCPLMDPEQVAEALLHLKTSGKVKHFGVSNFLPQQMAALEAYTDIPLLTNQIQMSVGCMDFLADDTLEDALRRKIPLMAYSPVAGGRLHKKALSRADYETLAVLQEIREELGAGSLDEVLYAWLYRLPGTVIPVTGTGKKERIQMALKALDLKMSREQWYDILRIARPPEVSKKYHDI